MLESDLQTKSNGLKKLKKSNDTWNLSKQKDLKALLMNLMVYYKNEKTELNI